MNRLLRFWLPVALQMGAIFYLSHQSKLPGPPGFIPHPDKIAHFVMFGLLAFLFLRALLNGRYRDMTWKATLATLLFIAAYGVLDEFHQSFIPTRQPDIYDWLADMSGGAAATVLGWVLWKREAGKQIW